MKRLACLVTLASLAATAAGQPRPEPPPAEPAPPVSTPAPTEPDAGAAPPALDAGAAPPEAAPPAPDAGATPSEAAPGPDPDAGPPAVDAAVESSASPCAAGSCGNHGTCEVQSGTPMCACEEGFHTDPTNPLECVPNVSAAPRTPAPALPERKAVEQADGRELGAEYADYVAGRRAASFAQYMHDQYSADEDIGLGMLVPGLALLFGGGACVAGAMNSEGDHIQGQLEDGTIASADDYQRSGLETGLYAAGAVGVVVGLGGLIAGSILLDRGREGQRRMAPLLRGPASPGAGRAAVEIRSLSPLWSQLGVPSGLAVELGF